MKLFAWTSGACAAVAIGSLLCGCSSSSRSSGPRVAQSPATLSEATSTTQLMSAQLPAPTPKVGKSHLAVDDLVDATDVSDELSLPKEARRSDGTRRGGHFGTTK